jgi:hypothetical protein
MTGTGSRASTASPSAPRAADLGFIDVLVTPALEDPAAGDSTDDTRPRTERAPARRIWPYLVCVAAPPLVLWLYRVEPFYRQNGVDPFIYAGYIFRPGDLIDRYGLPYFAVRFGLLAPSEAMVRLAGAILGYLLLRWLLVSGVLVVWKIWSDRVGRPSLALLGGAMFLLSPVTQRAVMTIYTDSVGVPYLAAAFALFLLPGTVRSRLVACAAGAVLVGLTINANLFMALPLGLALTTWLVIRVVCVRARGLLEGAVVVAGVVLTTAAGSLYYRLRFGDGNVLGASIDAARRLPLSVTPDRAPTREWVLFRPYLFLPLLAIAALVAVLAVQRSRPTWIEVAAVSMLTSASAVYLVQEFIFEGYLLETYFYTSFYIGPTILVLMLACRGVLDARTRADRLGAGLALVALFVPFALYVLRGRVELWTLPLIPLLIALIVALAVLAQNRKAPGAVLVTLLTVAPIALPFLAPANVPLAAGQPYRREPYYDASMFNADSKMLDNYGLASRFVELVPTLRSSPGTVVFWYGNDELSNLMGSTYLWLESAVHTGSSVTMPELDQRSIEQLQARTPRFVIVVAPSDRERDKALAALGSVVDSLHVIEARPAHAGVDVSVGIVELRPSSCDLDYTGTEQYWISLPPCPR